MRVPIVSPYIAPTRLRPGDRVAIVAPSSPVVTEELVEGLDICRQMRLEPVLGPCVRRLRVNMSHAASRAERAAELMWAFTEPGISAVLAAQGGVASAGVLPLLDYAAIRRSRRAFVGMSDNTSMNCALLVGSGLISINGQSPSIRQDKGEKIRHADGESWEVTLELLMSDEPWGERPFSFNPYIPRTVCAGRARGIAVGGNLDTLVHMFGTPWQPPLRGSIVFVEDVHKDGTDILRELIHLELTNEFAECSGIVVGEFADVPEETGERVPSVETVIVEQLGRLRKPCSMGWPFMHGPLSGPIPIGAACELDADSGRVSFDFRMG